MGPERLVHRLGAELVTLSGVSAVLLFPLELALALFIYIGYQITFSLGRYLVRSETLPIVSVEQLRRLDVAKQAGYLLGMGVRGRYMRAWSTLPRLMTGSTRWYPCTGCWRLSKSRWCSLYGGPSTGIS